MPPEGSDVIGETITTQTEPEDTLLDLARRYGLGYEEITNANPGVDPWLPGAGTVVVVPKQRLLPRAPRTGVVINLPEHRLYYFAPTTAGSTACRVDLPGQHRKDGLEHAAWKDDGGFQGQEPDLDGHQNRCARNMQSAATSCPTVVPAGPDNPMGLYALRLGIPGGAYLIHGTNRPAGVGMQVTHGCMRLYPEDIEALFNMVPVNTPVMIVNQPYKWGWHDGELLIEVHPPLQEDSARAADAHRPHATHRRGDPRKAARDRLDRRGAHLARGARCPDTGLGCRLAHRGASVRAVSPAARKAKAPRCRHRGALLLAYEVDYFDIDFSNMRLSFSLFASQHCCAACAADAA